MAKRGVKDDPLGLEQLERLSGDPKIVYEARLRYNRCVAWESLARQRGDADEKFHHGDSENNYQWPDQLYAERDAGDKPALTVNKVREHNLQIINDLKQNKVGIIIRPTGGGATYEAAQTFQAIVRHIEYESFADRVYDAAAAFGVIRGCGWWRIVPEYEDERSFLQKLMIRLIPNPKAVYDDPDAKDPDRLDRNFAFVYEDLPRDVFKQKYPKFAHLGNSPAPLGNQSLNPWVMRDHIRVAEYYRRHAHADTLHLIIDQQGNEKPVLESSFVGPEGKELLREALASMEQRNLRLMKREVTSNKVEWFKIAADEIISRTISPGQYIPLIKVCPEEFVIDGIMDRVGHTRGLKDPQRMYNYNASAAIEHGALQTKTPWIAAAEAIEGLEKFYNDANLKNTAALTWRFLSKDGKHELPEPRRVDPPQPSELFLEGMNSAEHQMEIASGQFRDNLGEQSNAISGVAINARQRRGDNATYHYPDAQGLAIATTGKVALDMIPHVYDTERIIRIKGDDGQERNIKITPDAKTPHAVQKADSPDDADDIIFNPNIGKYAVVSDPGPSFQSRRQEAFNALNTLFQADPELKSAMGDLYFRSADFPLADEMAERMRRLIMATQPFLIDDDAPTPQVQQLTQELQQLQATIKQLIEAGAKDQLDLKRSEDRSQIDGYRAETDRMSALKDLLPQDLPGLKQVIEGLVQDAINTRINGGQPLVVRDQNPAGANANSA